MKIKGVSFWEQHVEWIAVGLAGVLFVALLAMQFLGEPNAQMVEGRTVPPGQIDALLEQKATSIQAQMSRNQSDVPISTQESWLTRFQTASTSKVSVEPSLSPWQVAIGPGAGIVGPTTNTPFRVAVVPPPTDVRRDQYFDTLSAEVLEEHPELDKIFPAPYDSTWVTVAADVDFGAVLKQFNEPGPDGEAPLPLSWFNSRVDPVDVKLARQEQLPGNQWASEELLPPIPGQLTFRPKLQDRIESQTRNEILTALADPAQRAEIMQPQFYVTKNASWSPPQAPGQAAAPAPDDDDPKLVLGRQLEELKQKVIRLKKAIAERCGEGGGDPGRGPGGEGVGGGAGFGGPGPGGGGAAPKPKPDKPERKRLTPCDKLKRDLETVEEQVKKLEEQLGDAGAKDVPEQPKQDVPVGVGEEIVTVWAHDITAKPGKTYRYRIVVEVYNPLFARGLDLIESQQPIAEQFTLASAASEWSQPITVHPPLRIFVTLAQTSGAQGPARAYPEIYRYFGGRWWLNSAWHNAGDRIGKEGQRRRNDPEGLDYATDWFLLDVVEDLGSTTAGEHGERVLLQSLSQPDLTLTRIPSRDKTSLERQRLKGQVEQAEAEAKAALASKGG